MPGMVAIAVRAVGADAGPEIDRPRRAAHRREPADHVEAAQIAAQVEPRRVPAVGRHPIDRPAQRARAEAQRIGAAIDFEVIEEDRLQFLEIAIVVGEIDRHPVLEQRQPAHMIAARQARTANRDAHFLPVARLEIDARRKRQRVTQRHKRLVGIIFVRDDIGAAGSSLSLTTRSVSGGVCRDDDGRTAIGVRPLRRVIGEGRGGYESERCGQRRVGNLHGMYSR